MKNRRSGKQMGFSLVEVAVALVILGVIFGATVQVYHSVNESKLRSQTQTEMEKVAKALVGFAEQYYRLPCPDTTQDGVENCGGTAVTGTVPFHTLGLFTSSQASDVIKGHQNILYGVYRGTGEDLTELTEETGDAPGDQNYQTLGDLKQKLMDYLGSSGPGLVSSQPYVTGDQRNTGDEDCSGNRVANGAFILAGAVTDANGDGNDFDGVNEGVTPDGGGSVCFASPTRQSDADYNDLVRLMSFSELLGQLSN
ncbi:MAG: prepilin-type N-terminal cleavage/methylation domain-containing protein [Hydrogenovibrio sp.]|uniref:type II secretion system protein n=1 Tax=Hydrogenovibrio sp. TaxID=2065821 RepID=UPI002870A00C|nr:prepilin-type N-terminal cleavage/methylation domain-containing protein [Hydrogenovibrio sp.]MDR9497823.1 prepilin-type N-terminal cleavage/methylation domain-containing protein [Hydrogenovibrio sp.]